MRVPTCFAVFALVVLTTSCGGGGSAGSAGSTASSSATTQSASAPPNPMATPAVDGSSALQYHLHRMRAAGEPDPLPGRVVR